MSKSVAIPPKLPTLGASTSPKGCHLIRVNAKSAVIENKEILSPLGSSSIPPIISSTVTLPVGLLRKTPLKILISSPKIAAFNHFSLGLLFLSSSGEIPPLTAFYGAMTGAALLFIFSALPEILITVFMPDIKEINWKGMRSARVIAGISEALVLSVALTYTLGSYLNRNQWENTLSLAPPIGFCGLLTFKAILNQIRNEKINALITGGQAVLLLTGPVFALFVPISVPSRIALTIASGLACLNGVRILCPARMPLISSLWQKCKRTYSPPLEDNRKNAPPISVKKG